MKWLSTLLIFGGYILVYAATAAGGKFATEPWAGLFADAYVGPSGINPQAAGTGNLPPAVQNALHGNSNPPASASGAPASAPAGVSATRQARTILRQGGGQVAANQAGVMGRLGIRRLSL